MCGSNLVLLNGHFFHALLYLLTSLFLTALLAASRTLADGDLASVGRFERSALGRGGRLAQGTLDIAYIRRACGSRASGRRTATAAALWRPRCVLRIWKDLAATCLCYRYPLSPPSFRRLDLSTFAEIAYLYDALQGCVVWLVSL